MCTSLKNLGEFEILFLTLSVMIRMKKELVKLTEARAMLLYMIYQLVKNGDYGSI